MANFFDQFDNAASPEPDYGRAISSVESGGNYRAVGPATKTGDRALGKYQIMGANIGPWSREILGREVSPQEFIASDDIQDAIFKSKFGQYVQKYGPEGAARAWFAGEDGMNGPNRRDVLGTTVAGYAAKFNKALGPTDVSARAKGNFFDQFDEAPPVEQPAAPTIAERSDVSGAAPKNAAPLQQALEAEAVSRTRGEPSPPLTRMALDFMNQGSAAGQRTTPNIEAHQKNLISAKTYENDAGEILYEDNAGNLVRTDSNKQIALRDPADGKIKVYARTPETDEGVLSSAGRLMMTGMGAGAPTARPAIPTPRMAEVTPKASDIMATSKPYYKAFEAGTKNIEIPAETAQGMADRLRKALDKANLSDDMAGAPAKSAIKMLESGDTVSIDMLQRVKRMAGRGFNSPEKDVRDGAAAISGEISKIISEVAPEASKNLKTADAIHSTALAVQDLQRKGAVADLRAGRAGYGGNAVNTMRQVLSPIVQKAVEGRMTGFKPDEIAAMRDIVEGTPVTNAARFVGQLSPTSGLGVIKSAAAGGSAVGAGLSGGAALAIPALGYASNKLATVLTGRQIDRLRELVAKRSPAYSDAVAKSVKRYEDSQAAFVSDPSPSRLGAYVAASRALSSGLNKDGISITAGDLIRSAQGPVSSRAEDEQQ